MVKYVGKEKKGRLKVENWEEKEERSRICGLSESRCLMHGRTF